MFPIIASTLVASAFTVLGYFNVKAEREYDIVAENARETLKSLALDKR
jgi:hypothetical protein